MSGGGMWGSNPRHSEPQSDALPTELRPPCCSKAGAKVLQIFELCKFLCNNFAKKAFIRMFFSRKQPLCLPISPLLVCRGAGWFSRSSVRRVLRYTDLTSHSRKPAHPPEKHSGPSTTRSLDFRLLAFDFLSILPNGLLLRGRHRRP